MRKCITYDATGQRIVKTVTTYYVRDPQGKVLAVYEHKHGDSDNGTFTLTEQHLYGAGRLGMRKRDLALNVANASEPAAANEAAIKSKKFKAMDMDVHCHRRGGK